MKTIHREHFLPLQSCPRTKSPRAKDTLLSWYPTPAVFSRTSTRQLCEKGNNFGGASTDQFALYWYLPAAS